MKRPQVSVVIALYNEADNIQLLLNKSKAALQHLDYELILVDDGSTDGSAAVIKKYLHPDMKLIVLRKNYGQSAAMAAGINAARGEFIVTMDADLQNDPTDIPVMLEKLQAEDCDLVAGIRAKRMDNWLRKIPSRLANKLIRSTTGVTLHDYGCTLKVYRQDLAKNLGLYGDMHRFIPVLAAMQGASMCEMPVKHHPRIHGKSKYGIGRTAKVLSDLLLILFIQKYFQRPMHIFGPIGLLLFFSGLVINGYLLVDKMLGKEIGGRPLLILGVMLLLAGLQLIIFGFVAEILMRTYYESQHKKIFRIRSVIEFNNVLT
ncbi:family 2 glycosyl transferase [Niastella yeongjuensis]|uniref:Family 2 glycosyl transferase n=1 Tax=Niastella yeongjuensis TaxID=354355 RepID=A0A1V9E4E4_9BACT|nr:glycosyltransferase family 2 protein [Niastella yeongjuensis]OQP40785.1 family 2 glycosyl transferase [Niastella yeongjuensis]SEP01791.1 dolichol-phosphate mannosyltransferase [Niastella yeongjuensis]